MEEKLSKSGNKGAKWVGIQGLVQLVVYALQLVFITRFLSVETFGVFALAIFPVQLLMPWLETGFRQFIVQTKDLATIHLFTLFGINCLFSIFCILLLLLVIPFYADYYELPSLNELIVPLSSALVFVAIASLYRALLERALNFATLSIIQIVAILVEFILVIVLALLGYDIYALVYGYLARHLLMTLGIVGINFRSIKWSKKIETKGLRGAIRFASYESLNSMVNSWSSNIDKLIVGKMLGTHALGLYSLVREIILQPVARINPIFTRVAYPIFARLANDKAALNKAYRRLMDIIFMINTPLLFGLAVCSGIFLGVVFGEKWVEASSCLSVMCLVGLYKSWSGSAGVIILAKGRPDFGLFWNVLWSILLAGVTFLVLYFKPTLFYAGMAQLIACGLFGWILHVIASHIGEIDYRPILKDSLQIILLFLPMGIAVYFFLKLPINNELLRLISGIIVGAGIGIGLLNYFFKEKLNRLLRWEIF